MKRLMGLLTVASRSTIVLTIIALPYGAILWEGTTPPIQSYEFEFRLTKDTITVYEPVALRMAVTNLTDGLLPLPMLPSLFNDTRLMRSPVFVGPNGEAPSKPHIAAGAGQFVFSGTLGPGDTYIRYENYYPFMWRWKRLYPNGDPEAFWTGKTWRMDLAVNFAMFDTAGSGISDLRWTLPLTILEADKREKKAQKTYDRMKSHVAAGKLDDANKAWGELLNDYSDTHVLEDMIWDYALLGIRPDTVLMLVSHLAEVHPDSPSLIEWAKWVRNSVGEKAYYYIMRKIILASSSAPAAEIYVPHDSVLQMWVERQLH